jgi:hypothetical protein
MPSNNIKTPQDRQRKKTTKKVARAAAEATPQTPEDPNSKYAPTMWGSGAVGGLEDLVVPSGQLCQIRRPGLQGLMTAGVLHNVDSLSALVGEKHIKRAKDGTESVKMDEFIEDTEAVDKVMHTVDRIVTYCVVQPKVEMTPNDVTRRKPGVVYADMVDVIDKMFIVTNILGGIDDVATFRRVVSESVGSVDSVESVREEAE